MPKLKIWDRWDDNQKATAVRIFGICIAAFAVYTLIASFSYLFSWKEDQSLLSEPDMLSLDVPYHNTAGKGGYRLGHFLICRCFGLGSFGLIVILAAISSRILLHKWHYSLLKTTAVVISGAFVISLVLAYFSGLFGADNAFGGGLGGQCGSFIVRWSTNLIGSLMTFLLVALLVVGWLFLCSERFSNWLVSLGAKANDVEEDDDDMQPAEVKKPAPFVTPSVPSPAPAPVVVSEPAAKPAVAVRQEADEAGADTSENAEDIEVIRGNDLSTDVKKQLPRINVRDELPDYKMPVLDLLESHSSAKKEVSSEELTRNNNKIRASLANYKIQVSDVKAVVGPTITLYKVTPAPGVKISSIKGRQEDIAMSLNAKGVRIVTLNDSVGIEVANDTPSIVPLKALLNDDEFRSSKAELPIAIGYATLTQKVKVFDLTDAPHLLIAGATKQGKSVGLNVLVSSLLFTKHPSELKMVFIDPKMVEFSAYAGLLKHYLAVLPSNDEESERSNAIVKKAKDAERILKSLCIEMDERYELMSRAAVNNVKLYNEKYKDRHLLPTEGHKYLPYLVTIIDEYADLTMSIGGSAESKASSRSIQNSIIRLAQKGRAAGIHVVLATQRPSVDVISGIIKTNFPTRIAFRVVSRMDSMTILDMPGAEKLIGRGDMLYYAGVECERVQCGYISNDEINDITQYIFEQQGYKKSYNTPYYLPDPAPEEGEGGSGMIDMKDLDERFAEAAKLVVMTQKGSTSDLQRRLGMGYAKAGRVMDQLEAAGIVGPQEGSKPREVLVQDLDSLQQILNAYMK